MRSRHKAKRGNIFSTLGFEPLSPGTKFQCDTKELRCGKITLYFVCVFQEHSLMLHVRFIEYALRHSALLAEGSKSLIIALNETSKALNASSVPYVQYHACIWNTVLYMIKAIWCHWIKKKLHAPPNECRSIPLHCW